MTREGLLDRLAMPLEKRQVLREFFESRVVPAVMGEKTFNKADAGPII